MKMYGPLLQNIYPIGSMGLVYLPTFTINIKSTIHVGKYTSPMDGNYGCHVILPNGYSRGQLLYQKRRLKSLIVSDISESLELDGHKI